LDISRKRTIDFLNRRQAVSKIQAGDVILTNRRGISSRFISWAIGGKYSHVAPVIKVEKLPNGQLAVWTIDYKIGRSGKLRRMDELYKHKTNFLVARWDKNATGKPVTKEQIDAFVRNSERLKGLKYDVIQAVWYAMRQGHKKSTNKDLPNSRIADFAKRFTCSEQIATAGNPGRKDIEKFNLERITPPLIANPKMSRETETPTSIHESLSLPNTRMRIVSESP